MQAMQSKMQVKTQAQPVAQPPCTRRSCSVPSASTATATTTRSAGTDSPLLRGIQFISSKWADVETEAQFFAVLQAQVDAGVCPPQLLTAWADFYNNYKGALLGAGVPGHNEKLVAKIQSTIADCTLNEFRNPYTFPSHHLRLLDPYNYFEFGQRCAGWWCGGGWV